MHKRSRDLLGVSACLLALGSAAGCSSSSKSGTSATTPSTSASADSGAANTSIGSGGATTSAPNSTAKSGHLGDTLSVTDVGGDTATVTFVRMIDPATSTSAGSSAPDAGKHWVGFEATITDSGVNAGGDSLDALASGSDGQKYSVNSNISGHVSGCTSTAADAKPNEKATFCPGFLIPDGVTVTEVGYSTAGSAVGVTPSLTWTVP